jgi:hypothetical protein
VFPARYELNSYIVFRKRLVSKRLRIISVLTRPRTVLYSDPDNSGHINHPTFSQIQCSGFDSRCYQIFWEVVGLERGLLRLVGTIEEMLGRKSSCSGLEKREYGCRDPSRWPRDTLYPQKLALSSPTSGGRSIGIFRLRTQAAELFIFQRFTVALFHSDTN